MGKDHTIYATEAGYVRYYRDPGRHPKRRYIGVALEREGKRGVLPTPANAATRRRLGMYATPIAADAAAGSGSFVERHRTPHATPTSTASEAGAPGQAQARVQAPPPPVMRQGTYMQREANFEIGRAAAKKGITVREYDRGDRWLAWRKRAHRLKRAALARAAKANRKAKGKKSIKSTKGGPAAPR
jgi:hypothetical protein